MAFFGGEDGGFAGGGGGGWFFDGVLGHLIGVSVSVCGVKRGGEGGDICGGMCEVLLLRVFGYGRDVRI